MSFLAGPMIAVEKFDMRPGGTEFDFQINSRAVVGKRPVDIISMRESLNREFMEKRVKTNLFGMPMSIGNGADIVTGKAAPAATYGELVPQLFRSSVGTNPVGWRIVFKRAHYAGSGSKVPVRATRNDGSRIPSGVTLRPPIGAERLKEAGRATANANAASSARAASAPVASGQANGRVNPLGTGATLRVYVQTDAIFRPLAQPIGSHDMVFEEPTMLDRVKSMFR